MIRLIDTEDGYCGGGEKKVTVAKKGVKREMADLNFGVVWSLSLSSLTFGSHSRSHFTFQLFRLVLLLSSFPLERLFHYL